MMLRVLTLLFSIVMVPNSVVASGVHYFVVKEPLDNHRVKVKVIEEDESLRANQKRISQQVVSRGNYFENQVPSLSKLLKKRDRISWDLIEDAGVPKPLWVPTKDHWDEADEDAYSAWVASSVDSHFNEGSGLNADCADVGQLFRWVYAHDHLLPMANTLTGSGKLFGHFSGSSQWDALPSSSDWKKDERFKAALRYLFDNSYTRTLVEDIYPTLINPTYVRPGSLFMIIRPTSGHTQTIQNVDSKKGITTLWGNEPASDEIDQTKILVEFDNQEKFGRFRTPIFDGTNWLLTAAESMPGFSNEQFQQAFQSEFEMKTWINDRLNIVEDSEENLNGAIFDFYSAVQLRLKVTSLSLYSCFYNVCAPTSAAYDNYSTFSRDARLKKQIASIQAAFQKLGPDNFSVKDARRALEYYGEIVVGSNVSYLSLIDDPDAAARLDPHPEVSFLVRWGIAAQSDDLNFASLSAAIDYLMRQRAGIVTQGYQYCENGCDETSATAMAFDTTKFDLQFIFVFQKWLETRVPATLDESIVTKIKANFDSEYLLSTNGCTGTSSYCVYSDALWDAQALTRMQTWSPHPKDSILKRWGF